jgi:hypothetical protein
MPRDGSTPPRPGTDRSEMESMASPKLPTEKSAGRAPATVVSGAGEMWIPSSVQDGAGDKKLRASSRQGAGRLGRSEANVEIVKEGVDN